MNAIKPATPLPWKIVSERANEGMTAPVESEVRGDNRQVAVRLGRLYNDSQKADAAYIVTACNAYPRLLAEREELVKALRNVMDGFVGDRGAQAGFVLRAQVARGAHNLLAKLEAA